MKRAIELRAKGMSLRATARELKVGAATLQRALSAFEAHGGDPDQSAAAE